MVDVERLPVLREGEAGVRFLRLARVGVMVATESSMDLVTWAFLFLLSLKIEVQLMAKMVLKA